MYRGLVGAAVRGCSWGGVLICGGAPMPGFDFGGVVVGFSLLWVGGAGGWGPSFVPFCRPLAGIWAFVCGFACGVAVACFWWRRLYLPGCFSVGCAALSGCHLID